MDGEQQGVTCQIITGGKQTHGQLLRELFVEREAAIALTIVVGKDIVGLESHGVGLLRLIHLYVEHTAAAQFIDELHLELLAPYETTSIGIGLGDGHLAVSVSCVDVRHALLLDPDIAELTDADSGGFLVEGGDEIVP